MGTTAARKKLFFKLGRLKNRIAAGDETDLRPDQVSYIAEDLKVTPPEVVEMNRRIRGDASLNLTISDDETTEEWQDRLLDPLPDPESALTDADESRCRQAALSEALNALSIRERAILEARDISPMSRRRSMTLRNNFMSRGSASARSSSALSSASSARSVPGLPMVLLRISPV